MGNNSAYVARILNDVSQHVSINSTTTTTVGKYSSFHIHCIILIFSQKYIILILIFNDVFVNDVGASIYTLKINKFLKIIFKHLSLSIINLSTTNQKNKTLYAFDSEFVNLSFSLVLVFDKNLCKIIFDTLL